MAWESRGTRGPYYTRSRRVGGRVVREYIGKGPLADLVAQHDASTREHRARMAALWQEERERVEALDPMMEELEETCTLLTRLALLGAGYRQHDGGEWRQPRGKEDPGTGQE